MANENATYLDDGEVDLLIGSQDSLFRYRLTISSKKQIEFMGTLLRPSRDWWKRPLN